MPSAKVQIHRPLWKFFFRLFSTLSLHQIHNGVGQHLRVQAQIVLVHQGHGCRVRDAADAKLDAVAVIDQTGHIPADRLIRLGGLALGQIGQRRGPPPRSYPPG